MGRVIQLTPPEIPLDRLALYSERHHRSNRVDPPLRELMRLLNRRVSCIKQIKDSCAGNPFEEGWKMKLPWLTFPGAGESTAVYSPSAIVELEYHTSPQHLNQATDLEKELTSPTFEFTSPRGRTLGKIFCIEKEDDNISIEEDPRRLYFIGFSEKPDAEMLEMMWQQFTGIVREHIRKHRGK